jgi:hypothetical protein
LERVFVHCFLDGRDTPPASADGYIAALISVIEISFGQIATVCDRYYAMVRDKRWGEPDGAYDLLVQAEGERAADPVTAIRGSYERGLNDEFVEPIVIVNETGQPWLRSGWRCSDLLLSPRSGSPTYARADRKNFAEFLAQYGNRFRHFSVYDQTFPQPSLLAYQT